MSKTAQGRPALPSFSFPKFDLDGLVAMQKANVETALKVQQVVVDAAQAVAKLQAEWLNDTVLRVRALAKVDVAKGPDALFADTRAAAERAVAVARQGLDVGVRAQGEVADLVAKRVVANVDQVKSLAA